MNSWLAQAYGTNGSGRDSDVEKTAQAMMLSKLAEQEGIDLSGLNEEQLSLLAQEVSQQIATQQAGGGDPSMGGMGGGMQAPGGMPGAGGMPMGAPPPPAGGGMPMAPPSAQGAPPPMPAPAAHGAGPGPQAPQEGQSFSDEQVKVAQAKMAEADFLGRMMAHALHQEMGIIKAAEAGGGRQAPQVNEEVEAEKTAMAYLSARGFQVVKQASSEGPLTRAIRSLGGNVR